MAKDEDLLPDEPDTSIDPYETLNVPSTATEAEIRSAYKKQALRHHPDKVTPDERDAAKKEFQNIAFAYAILSDPKRRKRYDTTGSTAESALDDEDFDWSDYFRARYTEITAERVTEFEKEYKNSEEERKDLLKAYEKCKGRMDRVYEEVMLSNPLDDEERFQDLIKSAIEVGEVDEYDAFTKESAKSRKRRIDKAKKEAKEAEEYSQELADEKARKSRRANGSVDSDEGSESDEEEEPRPAKTKSSKPKSKGSSKKSAKSGGLGDLAAMIQQRQQGRAGTFLDDLEAKYAPKSGKGKKRPPMEEPPEEAFQRTAARKDSKKAKA